VQSQLQTLRPLFASYLRIRSLTSQSSKSSSPELAQARTELQTALTEITADLNDLSQSVAAVQKDPYRYGLEIEEVQIRQRFVQEASGEVEDMVEELSKDSGGSDSNGASGSGPGRGSSGITRSSAAHALRSPSNFDLDSPSTPGGYGKNGDDNDMDYIAAHEQQRQQELLQDQDRALEQVHHTIRHLHDQAGIMGEELHDQERLLEVIDDGTDRVGGKLRQGIKRVTWVMRHNEDTWSSCMIGVLIFVLIILLVIALLI
jgi:t-SNARE syntaxin family protein